MANNKPLLSTISTFLSITHVMTYLILLEALWNIGAIIIIILQKRKPKSREII